MHALVLFVVLGMVLFAPAWASDEGDADALTPAEKYQQALDLLDSGTQRGVGEGMDLVYEAAEEGHPSAQWTLGVLFGSGSDFDIENIKKSLQWHRAAAEQGYAPSQASLGVLYYNGYGVPQDYAEAARLYRLGAEQGDVYAQSLLAAMHSEGKGVPQDYVQAHKWSNLAAAQGSKAATEFREDLAKDMTLEQISEAQRLAREWMESQSPRED